MEFKTACKVAFDYFKKEYEDDGLNLIEDVGDRWAFLEEQKNTLSFMGSKLLQ